MAQEFIFDPEKAFSSYGYNDEANEEASGFGRGMAIYDAPASIQGGTQIPIDLSTRTISPQVLFSNPQWMLVVLGLVTIVILMLKGNK